MKLLTPSLLLFSAFVLGGLLFKSAVSYDCGYIKPDDSAFVLTGDARRIPFAMRQLRENPNLDLYIIGAGAENYYNTSKKVTVESESKSTYQNALAIKKIAQRTGIDRLVVITTEDHINRAKYLIKQELPEVNVITCPVPLFGMPTTKRLERWTIEYIKYIATLFGIKEG